MGPQRSVQLHSDAAAAEAAGANASAACAEAHQETPVCVHACLAHDVAFWISAAALACRARHHRDCPSHARHRVLQAAAPALGPVASWARLAGQDPRHLVLLLGESRSQS